MDAIVLWSLALPVALLILTAARVLGTKIRGVNEVSGFLVWQAVDNWVDFIVYPAALITFGPLYGFLVMAVGTLGLNLVYVIVNKITQTDWTFMEAINGLRVVKRVASWKVGKLLIFIALSIKFDSFVATTFYFGKSVDFKSRSFWGIFLGSHLIANALWAGGLEVVIIAIRALFGV